ncbi:PID-CTERM protein-sorting domain-containing protein [Lutibacter sp. B1]|jgi:hypothetical protein|uniref:PID-CTERM protein-sorting domain-containing protein n=1 Tax=Lutibacter sp. B1 TaxID=2725996 RepID=UPI001457108F|nr:hypothetical protein [Lutibacter sp. B1]NLP57702.1 hypothetical protein [Lutibacter sp. B1]
MKIQKYTYLASFCLLFFCVTVVAQVPPPPVGLPVPIDGNIIYLLISGIAFGVYTLKRRK